MCLPLLHHRPQCNKRTCHINESVLCVLYCGWCLRSISHHVVTPSQMQHHQRRKSQSTTWHWLLSISHHEIKMSSPYSRHAANEQNHSVAKCFASITPSPNHYTLINRHSNYGYTDHGCVCSMFSICFFFLFFSFSYRPLFGWCILCHDERSASITPGLICGDCLPIITNNMARRIDLFYAHRTTDTAFYMQNTALGTGGILYNNGSILSGPHDSLVSVLLPNKPEDLDKVCILLLFILSEEIPL